MSATKRKRGRQPESHGRWSPFVKRQVVGRVLAVAGTNGDIARATAKVALTGHPHLRLNFPKRKESRDTAGYRVLIEPRSDAKVRGHVDAADGTSAHERLERESAHRPVEVTPLPPLTDTMIRDAYYAYLATLERGSRECDDLTDEIAEWLPVSATPNSRAARAAVIIASRLQQRDKAK